MADKVLIWTANIFNPRFTSLSMQERLGRDWAHSEGAEVLGVLMTPQLVTDDNKLSHIAYVRLQGLALQKAFDVLWVHSLGYISEDPHILDAIAMFIAVAKRDIYVHDLGQLMTPSNWKLVLAAHAQRTSGE